MKSKTTILDVPSLNATSPVKPTALSGPKSTENCGYKIKYQNDSNGRVMIEEISNFSGLIKFHPLVELPFGKSIPEMMTIEKNQLEFYDASWQNTKFEAVIYNFANYFNESEDTRKQIQVNIEEYIQARKAEGKVMYFDEKTGNVGFIQ